jgi:hypothetical protein
LRAEYAAEIGNRADDHADIRTTPAFQHADLVVGCCAWRRLPQ